MDGRGTSLLVGVVVAIVLGVGSAFAYHQVKGTQTAITQPTPSPQASPSEIPSPSPSPEVSPSPSPSPAPSPTPTAPPSPAPTQAPAARAAAYPPQLIAGSSYPYSGSGSLFVGASDSRDLGGQGVCAGINDSAQSFPSGYEGVYFAAIQFPDGNRISVGFVRSASGRQDFATVQNNGNGLKQGVQVAGPTSGSHNYCIQHSGSNWVATDDGNTIFSTTAETASSISGQLLFESSAQHFQPSSPVASFGLVVPGFHDIAVDGKAPTQLIGFSVTT